MTPMGWHDKSLDGKGDRKYLFRQCNDGQMDWPTPVFRHRVLGGAPIGELLHQKMQEAMACRHSRRQLGGLSKLKAKMLKVDDAYPEERVMGRGSGIT